MGPRRVRSVPLRARLESSLESIWKVNSLECRCESGTVSAVSAAETGRLKRFAHELDSDPENSEAN
jgi:hypothetical protein